MKYLMLLICILIFTISLQITFGQEFIPPIPVEFVAGHQSIYNQIVVKKPIFNTNHIHYINLSTYTAGYDLDTEDNRMISINQFSYTFWKGLGIMGGWISIHFRDFLL